MARFWFRRGKNSKFGQREQGNRYFDSGAPKGVLKENIIEPKHLENVEEEGKFENFSLFPQTMKNLRSHGIEYLFPIQISTFKYIFEGRDIFGKDRTGSGKTLAYILPVLERLRE
jgi:ATP-dependent RNA helicase DDX21